MADHDDQARLRGIAAADAAQAEHETVTREETAWHLSRERAAAEIAGVHAAAEVERAKAAALTALANLTAATMAAGILALLTWGIITLIQAAR